MVSKTDNKDPTDKSGLEVKVDGKPVGGTKVHGEVPIEKEVIAWDDPCSRYKALSDAYLLLLTGGGEASVMTRTLDAAEEVRFNKADIKILKMEMDKAKAECEVASGLGGLPSRFAIGGVFKPRCCRPRRP